MLVELTDIGVIERHCTSFVFKSFTELGLGDFDRDDSVQACIAGLADVAHSTRTDRRKDFVWGGLSPG